MKKRFSWMAFLLVAVVHICGTLLLLQAGFWAEKTPQAGQSFSWIAVWSWIWWPLPRLLWQLSPSTHAFQGVQVLTWSLCIGTLFGFVMPRFFAWRHKTI